jgi:tripeptidyl-peptidase-1
MGAIDPTAFSDIDTGSGGGCSDGLKRVSGYPALKGWDPVTGLGTPDYQQMVKLLA